MMDGTPMLIETIEDSGSEWGVSYDGPNPPAHGYLACRDRAHAERLLVALQSPPRCPNCGSAEVIAPGASYRKWTCDPCGHEWPEVSGAARRAAAGGGE